MPDDRVRPPDLAAAGIAPQAPDLSGLMGGYGSMPQAALGMLQTPPAPAPSPLMALGAALSGRGAQFAGLAGSQAAQAQQQQMQQTRLLMEVQRMRQAQTERRLDAMRTVGLHLIARPTQAERQLGMNALSQYAHGVGIPLDPSLTRSIIQGELTPTQMDEIRTRLTMGTDPATVAQMYHTTLEAVTAAGRLPENPAARKLFGLKTPEERQMEVLNLQSKALEVWGRTYGIDKSSPVYTEMTRRAKKPIDQMTDPELQALRADAETAVKEQGIQDKLRVIQTEQAIAHKNRMAEIAERERLAQLNPRNNPMFKPGVQKLQAQAKGFSALISRAQRVKDAVATLDKEGLLTTGGTVQEWLYVQALAQTKMNRPEINAAFNTLQRYGIPLIVNAEKELAGQPIGSMLRLKSVVESEVGGIARVPAVWWKDFFEDYDRGLASQQALVTHQLNAMGIPLPSIKPTLTVQQYAAFRARGYTDAQIRGAYDVPQ